MRKLLYLLTFFFTTSIYSQDTLSFTMTTSHANDFLRSSNAMYNRIFEGCSDITIDIVKPNELKGNDNSFELPISFSGKAEFNKDYLVTYNGEDLTQGNFITIDRDTVTIVISPIHDLKEADGFDADTPLDSAFESLIFTIDSTEVEPVYFFSSLADTFEIYDQPELELTTSPASDTLIHCPLDSVFIGAELRGGVGQYMKSPFYNGSPYTFEWDQVGLDPSQPVTPEKTTDYWVTAKDVCKTQIVKDSIKIIVPIYPDIEAVVDSTYVCSELELDSLCAYDVYGGEGESYTYSWSNSNNPQVEISSESCLESNNGEYILSISDVCNSPALVIESNIILDEAPDPFFEYLAVPDAAIKLELNNYTPLMDDLKHQWYFKNINRTSDVIKYIPNQHPIVFNGLNYVNEIEGDSINPVTILTPGTYDVKLKVTTEINDCTKEYSEYITLEPSYFFYAPNAFTPNGDALNDSFRPIVVGSNSYELFVYDSFGKVIFSTSDIEEKWDGTYNGIPAAEGIYIYKVVLTKQSDVVVFSEQGTVTLIR